MLVQKFYNQNQFPGPYTLKQLKDYGRPIENPYLELIDQNIQGDVLDAGCGTGLITNLFALRYPKHKFTAVDFADGINYAKTFAITYNIKNARFVRQDLHAWQPKQQYDTVICQGVLHHIPEYVPVLDKLKQTVKPGGKLILGLYHPWGKLLKKYINIDYASDVLYKDQELNPWEYSFTQRDVVNMTREFKLISKTPKRLPIFNSRNGGLVTYVLEKL
jgi:trans-aconitate methyltransferase